MAVLIGGILGGQIQGRLGGNVYSTRNGKTYVRSVAKRTAPVTEAAKAQQELFSKAGIMCSHLYTAIKTSITLPSLTEMHGKIMSAMLHWLKGHPLKGDHTSFFKGCIPAKCVSLTERWCRHVQVSHKGNGVIRIAIPSLIPVAEFIAPPQTASVTCRMVVAGLLATDGSLTGTSTPCTSDTDCDGAAEICDVTDGFCVDAIVGHAGGHGRSGGAGIRGAGGAGGHGGAGTGGA